MSVPMWTIVAKNSDSTAIVTIDDLGISIEAGGQITLSDHYDQLATSDDLRQLVDDGDIVINDGSSDLSAVNGVKYLTFIQSKYLSDNHYTKTELQSSGSSSVHWDNLTNVPPFGSPRWLAPVLARVIAIQSAAPSGTEGQFYIDTDDNHLYKYVTSSWVDQGAPSDEDRVINLDSTSQVIYQYDLGGDSWDAQSEPSDGDAVLVLDDGDGDGNQAQYVYDLSTLSWVKIADVDWEGNTLDKSYDEGGAGAGRIITVDSGSVKLDATSGTYAPIELTQQSTAPSLGLAAGQLTVVGGIPYVYDGTRAKWLSIQRGFFTFGRNGLTRSQYLDFYVGNLTSNNSGLRIVRNATIVSLSGQFSSSGTGTFQIRKNDSSSNISTLLLSATSGAEDTTINVNLDAGDYLQAAMSATSPFVNDPIIVVEIAFRI